MVQAKETKADICRGWGWVLGKFLLSLQKGELRLVLHLFPPNMVDGAAAATLQP